MMINNGIIILIYRFLTSSIVIIVFIGIWILYLDFVLFLKTRYVSIVFISICRLFHKQGPLYRTLFENCVKFKFKFGYQNFPYEQKSRGVTIGQLQHPF